MIWLMLGAWLLLLGSLLGFSWYRAARGSGGERPKVVPLALVPVVVVVAGGLYALLGLHRDTAQWVHTYHDHRDDVLSLLTPEPSPAVQEMPLGDVTRVMQRIATQRDSAQAWYAVAMLYDELEGKPQAVQAARKAAELSPGEFGPRLMLARSLINDADGELIPEARALLEELLAEQPEHDGARMLVAMAAMRSGDYDLAIEALDSLLSRHTSEEAAGPLRRARERAVTMRENQAWLRDIVVRVEAPDSLPAGGTLFVFLRRAGEQSGQPLAAVRVLADSFPATIAIDDDDWLQSLPAPGASLVAGARYSPAPGSAVDKATMQADSRPLQRRDERLRATLQLR